MIQFDNAMTFAVFRCFEILLLRQSDPIMEISFELKQRDFYDAIMAHRSRSLVTKWLYRIPMYFALLVWAACLLCVIVLGVPLSIYIQFMILTAVWAGIFEVLPRWSARNQFLKQPAAQGLKTVSLDEAGIHWQWNGGSSDNEWKNIVRILEAKNHFLFYSSPCLFSPVPKRGLLPDQLPDLRVLLTKHASNFRGIK